MDKGKLSGVSPQELLNRLPKKTKQAQRQEKRKNFWEFIKFIFRIDTRSANTYSYGNNDSPSSAPMRPSPSESFREGQRFNPEEAYIRRMQEMGYHQLVDGRGDPPEHNCDHHHGHGER